MIFNRHSALEGRHAFLSASKYHWVNYDLEKLERTYTTQMAAQRGTELHALAHELIRLGVKLPRTRTTMNLYVNDGIGYKMTPEQILYYSDNCFGTADTLAFRNGVLRISDLKTGASPVCMKQLEVYAALFCFEYRFKPFEIETQLRIYQSDDVIEEIADPDSIVHVMDRITTFDKAINVMKEEARG